MKDISKYVLKLIMRFFLKIYWILPIKTNNIFFMSNMGKHYSCNPKYIYEYLLNDLRFKNYKLIWCFKGPKDFTFLKYKKNTILINKKNIIKYFYYLLTSKVIVYNCGGFSYAPIRKGQVLIETWHGGGAFKKVGISYKNKSKASKKGIMLASKDITFFLSTSFLNTKEFIKKSMNYDGQILNFGYPRNDIFFNYDNKKIDLLKNKLKISLDYKIILYAPTFKGEENHAVNINNDYELIDPKLVKKALSTKFGGKWLFLVRGHQYSNDIEIDGSDLDLSLYEDMQELLLISDVLITDYSSSIWDYSLLKRPCFLFAPDLNEYENEERGFLTPITTWPGIVVQNNNQLTEEIIKFCENEYIRKINRYLLNSESYEKGNACVQVANCIYEVLEKGREK